MTQQQVICSREEKVRVSLVGALGALPSCLHKDLSEHKQEMK